MAATNQATSAQTPTIQAPTASSSKGQPCVTGLLRPATSSAAGPSTDRATVRERAVTIDLDRLQAMPDRLTLNLFDDVCLVALKRGGPSDRSPVPVWTGIIEGVAGSNVTVVLNAGVVSASVISPPHAYQVELMNGDVHRVREVDGSKYPNEHPPLTPPPAPPPPTTKKKP